jgi:S1-C subfamily serine protease
MRNILTLTALLALCLISLAGTPDEILHNKCIYPTVLVAPHGMSAFGSGIIVKSVKVSDKKYNNVFLTCAHVCSSKDPYEVRLFKYENWSKIAKIESFDCELYGVNDKTDIAVGVFVTDVEMPVAQMDFNPKLFIGNEVFRIGCGLGDEPRLDYGKITSLNMPSSDGVPAYRTSVHTVPGDSGSPLFHENKVIGIVKSIRLWRGLPVFNISFAVPLDEFKKWSKDNDDSLDFIFADKEIPKMPLMNLKLKEYDYFK